MAVVGGGVGFTAPTHDRPLPIPQENRPHDASWGAQAPPWATEDPAANRGLRGRDRRWAHNVHESIFSRGPRGQASAWRSVAWAHVDVAAGLAQSANQGPEASQTEEKFTFWGKPAEALQPEPANLASFRG